METFKRCRRYIIAAVFGMIVVIFVCWIKELSFGLDNKKIYKILCDGTFLATVILIGLGVLVSISNLGLFTALSYSLKRFITFFSMNYEQETKNIPSYYEYRAMKFDTDVSGAFLYIIGIIYFIISLLFLILYNR